MRIVGGKFRGRPLVTPKSNAIRPTTDRARESLFNILNSAYPDLFKGARVLDLFAGTGALGLEAMSRGANACCFVEEGVEGRGLLRTNIESLGLQGATRILRRDATQLGNIGTIKPFTLLFADPPYNKGLGEKALVSAASGGWIEPGAICILEESASAPPPRLPGFEPAGERRFGDTIIRIFRFV